MPYGASHVPDAVVLPSSQPLSSSKGPQISILHPSTAVSRPQPGERSTSPTGPSPAPEALDPDAILMAKDGGEESETDWDMYDLTKVGSVRKAKKRKEKKGKKKR